MDPELGKFKAGSGSGINHSGSTTLVVIYAGICDLVRMALFFLSRFNLTEDMYAEESVDLLQNSGIR